MAGGLLTSDHKGFSGPCKHAKVTSLSRPKIVQRGFGNLSISISDVQTTIELAFGQKSDTELLDTFCYHMNGLDSLDDASRTQMRLAAHTRSTLIARGGYDSSGNKLSRFSNIQPSPNLEQLENAFLSSALRDSRSENV